jgi:hypothetical protein
MKFSRAGLVAVSLAFGGAWAASGCAGIWGIEEGILGDPGDASVDSDVGGAAGDASVPPDAKGGGGGGGKDGGAGGSGGSSKGGSGGASTGGSGGASNGGSGGEGGMGGALTGGSAGQGGAAGEGGSAGVAGDGGSAGTAGDGGSAGTAGEGGSAGAAGDGGSAGTAGDGGSAGTAGDGGVTKCGDGTTQTGEDCDLSPDETCTTSCASFGTRSCLTNCTWTACIAPAEVCNDKDDDCDGVTDNGFDKQGDVNHCGSCGNVCSVAFATALCSSGACAVGTCESGHYDVDGAVSNGCEYACSVTNAGVEICDGLDNDCDGQVDGTSVCPTNVGTFTATGAMAAKRTMHGAVLLQSGKVLIVGGRDGNTCIAPAERYDPAAKTWSSAGQLVTPRQMHSTALLPSGKVIVAGGLTSSNALVSTSEIYDPATNTWSSGPSFSLSARASQITVPLSDGKVLIAIGLVSYPDCGYRTDAEVYDPVANKWESTGAVALARGSATATLLADGRVLLAGGPANGCPGLNPGVKEAEIYDPAGGTWSPTGDLLATRYAHSLTTLPDGKVLVAGGQTGNTAVSSCELFDPTSGMSSTASPIGTKRSYHTATVLNSGKVLFTGGSDGIVLSAAEFYAAGAWSPTKTALLEARAFHTATRLTDGKVLIVGGQSAACLSTAELFDETQ